MNEEHRPQAIHDRVPGPGELIEVLSGVFWARLPLPFSLNHVNIYIIDDGDSWCIIDTGIGDDTTEAAWDMLLSGPLSGRSVTRLICTHHHPDHAGMAGWFWRNHETPLLMSQGEYLMAQHYNFYPGTVQGDAYRRLYGRHGLSTEKIAAVMREGHNYQHLVTGLPDHYTRLQHGDRLRIGGRMFEVFTGGGHSCEQLTLYCREESFFIAADQVLPRITPNIGIIAIEPEGDPLGLYLRSLAQLRSDMPDLVTVLPGHDWPFFGLHRRIDGLISHHETRCNAILAACSKQALTTLDLIPYLFRRPLDLHQTSFAFAETLAHVNVLIGRGNLAWEKDDGVWRARTV